MRTVIISKIARRTGRSLGIVFSGILLLILVAQTSHALSTGEGGITFDGIAFTAVVLLAVAGCITSWWRQWLGGILLISSAVVSVLRPVLFALWLGKDVPQMLGNFYQGSGFWLSTFPILIAGALLLVSSRLGHLNNY